MDCVDAEAKTHAIMSRNSSQPTGTDPNFCQILKIKLALPRDANFAPVLTVRSVDHRLFGASKPTVGSCSIPLDSHVFALFRERDASVGVDPMFNTTMEDEEAKLAAELDLMTPEAIDNLHREIQEKKQKKEKEAQSPSAALVIEEDEDGQELQRRPSSPEPFQNETETAVVTGPDLVVAGEDVVMCAHTPFPHYFYVTFCAALPAFFLCNILCMSDDEAAPDDRPHYMTVNGRQREELQTSVDTRTGKPPFDSFVLMRGRAKGRGFLSRLLKMDAPANVGTFKASIVVTRSKEQMSPSVAAQALSLIPKQTDLTPRMLVVRVYVLKGFRLYNGDSSGGSDMNTYVTSFPHCLFVTSSDSYVKVGLGATVISRRDFSRRGNDNVEYYQAFEIAANLPGEGRLRVRVM